MSGDHSNGQLIYLFPPHPTSLITTYVCCIQMTVFSKDTSSFSYRVTLFEESVLYHRYSYQRIECVCCCCFSTFNCLHKVVLLFSSSCYYCYADQHIQEMSYHCQLFDQCDSCSTIDCLKMNFAGFYLYSCCLSSLMVLNLVNYLTEKNVC